MVSESRSEVAVPDSELTSGADPTKKARGLQRVICSKCECDSMRFDGLRWVCCGCGAAALGHLTLTVATWSKTIALCRGFRLPAKAVRQ